MKKFVAIIMVCAVMLCSLTGCSLIQERIDQVLHPEYETSAVIYIANNGTQFYISSGDLAATQSLSESYKTLFHTERIQTPVKEQFPETEYTAELEAMEETEVFRITVKSQEPENLEDICNLLAESFAKELPEIINGISVKIVDTAGEPTPSK